MLFELQATYPDLRDRALRDIYSSMAICSTASKPYGLYLPATPDELESFLAEYACHARGDKVNARRAVFMSERPDLRPDAARQMELPL